MEFITHVKNINGFKKIGGANRMKDLISSPQNIVVIGDMYVSTDVMVESLEKSKINCGKIIRPAYRNVCDHKEYVPLDQR